MKPRSILLVVVAFLLGAVAAGSIGVRVIREVRTDEDATSLPPASTTSSTTAPPATYQVDPTETLIGSTALVPIGVEASGSSGVAISYDLVVLAPHAQVDGVTTFSPGTGITTVPIDEANHIYPRRWVLETTGGVFEGGPSNYGLRIARFDVDDGFSLSEILDVRVVEAVTPFPLEVPFTLSNEDPTVEVVPGIEVELLNVSDQGTSSIVQVAINGGDPELTDVLVRGDGPGWRSAVFEAEGRPRINLTFVGEELPDPIPLVASATLWVEIPGEFSVDVGAFL